MTVVRALTLGAFLDLLLLPGGGNRAPRLVVVVDFHGVSGKRLVGTGRGGWDLGGVRGIGRQGFGRGTGAQGLVDIHWDGGLRLGWAGGGHRLGDVHGVGWRGSLSKWAVGRGPFEDLVAGWRGAVVAGREGGESRGIGVGEVDVHVVCAARTRAPRNGSALGRGGGVRGGTVAGAGALPPPGSTSRWGGEEAFPFSTRVVGEGCWSAGSRGTCCFGERVFPLEEGQSGGFGARSARGRSGDGERCACRAGFGRVRRGGVQNSLGAAGGQSGGASGGRSGRRGGRPAAAGGGGVARPSENGRRDVVHSGVPTEEGSGEGRSRRPTGLSRLFFDPITTAGRRAVPPAPTAGRRAIMVVATTVGR